MRNWGHQITKWRQAWTLALVLVLAGLVGSEASAAVSERERQIGRTVAATVESTFGLLEDPERLARVAAIGRRLEMAAGRTPGGITFRLLDQPDFNALALPGNTIYVMRGLVDMVESDSELAAALAHEVAHITLGHTRQLVEASERRMTVVVEDVTPDGKVTRRKVSAPAESATNGHEKELDADREALVLLQRAGYDPRAALHMLERLRSPEEEAEAASGKRSRDLASTHPTVNERIRRVKEHLRRMASR